MFNLSLELSKEEKSYIKNCKWGREKNNYGVPGTPAIDPVTCTKSVPLSYRFIAWRDTTQRLLFDRCCKVTKSLRIFMY